LRLRTTALLLLLFLAWGCAPGAVPSEPAPAATETPLPAAPPPDPEIRLAFVGDILLGGELDGIIQYRGVDYPWVHAAPILRQADLAIGNLETAVSRRGTPSPDKQFTFRSRPETLAGAARAGMDVLSLANNHALDYGRDALLDTIANVRAAGMHPVGAGKDLAEAFSPALFEVRGLKVAVLGFTRVIPFATWVAGQKQPGLAAGWEPEPVLAAVTDASTRADVVVVLFHWGEEVKDIPRASDMELARQLIDAGATVIVGHHPHVLQGIDLRGSGLIAYSLGNFIFTSVSRPLNQETGILAVTVTRGGVKSARFHPMYISQGQPRPADAKTARRIQERLDRLSVRWQTRVADDFTISALDGPD